LVLRQYIVWTPPKKYQYYITKVFEDDTLFCLGDKDDFFLTFLDGVSFDDDLKPVKRLTDFSLFTEYQTFDFDMNVPARYAMLHNELIDRGLMIKEQVNPNDFNTGFDYGF